MFGCVLCGWSFALPPRPVVGPLKFAVFLVLSLVVLGGLAFLVVLPGVSFSTLPLFCRTFIFTLHTVTTRGVSFSSDEVCGGGVCQNGGQRPLR